MNKHYSLNELGWRDFFADQLDPELDGSLVPARVVRQDLDRYHLLTGDGERGAILPGRMRIDVATRAALPTVGDWVLCRESGEEAEAPLVIERVMERFSKFSRKEAGDRFEEQVVAANVDTVFIVSGLDNNFNPSRIERYLVLAWNSGAAPVIVLSKSDLCDNVEERLEALEAVAMATPIVVASALTEAGIDSLRQWLIAGRTVALLGSSGVGKSTLINALLGFERFETGEVRVGDSKGRHTTTYRELVAVPSGGLLIDTPGMREIQIWADDGLGGFDDVEELASQCRFNDCRHESEPGCAVREAIEAGQLDVRRLDSWHKFKRELAHFEEKQDISLRAEKKQERRSFSKRIRNTPTKRDV